MCNNIQCNNNVSNNNVMKIIMVMSVALCKILMAFR